MLNVLGCLLYKPDPGIKVSFLVCLNSSWLESCFQNQPPAVLSPSSALRKRSQHLASRRPSMNANCAGGKRNLESTCSVESGTVAARETEEGNVVLGGHSPSAGLRNEGLDSDYRHPACPASPQFSSMLPASEDTHSCHFQDGTKRQTEYFNPQERHAVSSSINSQTVAPEKVTLVVDGTRFAVNPQIFTAHPDTMLGRRVRCFLTEKSLSSL
uniref:BTBD10/KCTD20 BTB/POZ domain-containing protein n=1 Tax=Pavo cristatus TaxID=9049 RepID=A0A8C9L4D2_PAVCR